MPMTLYALPEAAVSATSQSIGQNLGGALRRFSCFSAKWHFCKRLSSQFIQKCGGRPTV